MRLPDREAVSELLDWPAAPHGILSVSLRFDPADHGEAWRIELRNGLSDAVDRARAATDRDTRLELEATVKRVLERQPTEKPHPDGRAQLGFLEVSSRRGAREEWFGAQLAPRRTEVAHGARPYLLPLMTLLDDGEVRGVLVISAERARLLEWKLGSTEELDSWDLEILSLGWRERKGQRPPDPAVAQGARASGRDQYHQRLEANSQRFLREVGHLAQAQGRERSWREVMALGRPEQAETVIEHDRSDMPIRAGDGHDLISASVSQIAERLEALVERRNREREAELVQRVLDAALGGTRGVLGAQETFQALAEGRVEHLAFDAEHGYAGEPVELGGEAADVPLAERMIEMAFATGAAVTPLEGEPARRLSDSEGVGALLRY